MPRKHIHWILPLPLLVVTLACASSDPVARGWSSETVSSGGEGGGDSGEGGGTHQLTSSAASGGSNVGAGGEASGIETFCPKQQLSLFPLNLTKGDREFNSHGPDVDVTVKVNAPSSTTIELEACVVMKETKSDWTTGEACAKVTLDHPNNGIESDAFFKTHYTDSDHESDDAIGEAKELDDASFVDWVRCMGDHDGDDICGSSGCSRCDVAIGCIEVRAPQ